MRAVSSMQKKIAHVDTDCSWRPNSGCEHSRWYFSAAVTVGLCSRERKEKECSESCFVVKIFSGCFIFPKASLDIKDIISTSACNVHMY